MTNNETCQDRRGIGFFEKYLSVWVISNFFELAVAVAISLFGLQSGATLATVVGVLVEVPVMLTLVKIATSTRHWFVKL